jgi:hypothetical protein
VQKALYVTGFVALAANAIAAQAAKPKKISHEEASVFERSLLARRAGVPTMPAMLYTQPVNKAEPCRLPTSRDQLDRPNFRAFWDGECKNGFATGLGRDIAISDTHHAEEITIHDGSGADWSRPSVYHDYVNNVLAYSVGGAAFPAQVSFEETMNDPASGFNPRQTLRVVDEEGQAFVLNTSSFAPQRVYVNSDVGGSIAYRFTDNSSVPVMNPTAPVFAADVVDPKSRKTGGVVIVRYANGAVEQFRMLNGTPEAVRVPASYSEHLQAKYQEILDAFARSTAALQRAQQIEREYLFKACNGEHHIAGLEEGKYKKICSWRNQFKEPYAAASANYQRQLEGLQRLAATAAEQRLLQQQIALQQQNLSQQQNQQFWSQLNQGSQQMQQNSANILQSITNWQAPQAQPIAPLGGSKVICRTIGSTTICR